MSSISQVHQRLDQRRLNDAKTAAEKTRRTRKLNREAQALKVIMNRRGIQAEDLKVAHLRLLCKWKKQKGDSPLPVRKAELLLRYEQTKDDSSTDVEDDEDVGGVDSFA